MNNISYASGRDRVLIEKEDGPYAFKLGHVNFHDLSQEVFSPLMAIMVKANMVAEQAFARLPTTMNTNFGAARLSLEILEAKHLPSRDDSPFGVYYLPRISVPVPVSQRPAPATREGGVVNELIVPKRIMSAGLVMTDLKGELVGLKFQGPNVLNSSVDRSVEWIKFFDESKQDLVLPR